ncbi:hypothetical protein LguiA_023617 [Lonicera macranthoides]
MASPYAPINPTSANPVDPMPEIAIGATDMGARFKVAILYILLRRILRDIKGERVGRSIAIRKLTLKEVRRKMENESKKELEEMKKSEKGRLATPKRGNKIKQKIVEEVVDTFSTLTSSRTTWFKKTSSSSSSSKTHAHTSGCTSIPGATS